MTFPKRQLTLKLRQIVLIIICCLCLILSNTKPVLASIHAYPISANEIMYRSQQSLRDKGDSSWQLVLYKTASFGVVETVRLRLVGFPGLVKIARPQSLQIATATGRIWQAENTLINSSFPASVGEYDLMEVMKELETEIPLWLTIPLKGDREELRELVVPPFAVKEWIQLLDK